MNLEKWIPNYVLHGAIAVNYITALVGAYMGESQIMIISVLSIFCCGVGLWARKKQKDDKS